MSRGRSRTRLPPAVLAVRGAAGALAVAGLAHTLWHGLHEPGLALTFGVLITVGELARWGALPGEREPAPLGAAGALAYALLGRSGGEPTSHGALQVIAVLVAAQLVAAVPHVARGSGPTADQVARRIIIVSFAAVCFQPLHNSGRSAVWFGDGPYFALFLLVLLVLTALCDAVLGALLLRSGTPSRTDRCSVTSCALCWASVRRSARPGR